MNFRGNLYSIFVMIVCLTGCSSNGRGHSPHLCFAGQSTFIQDHVLGAPASSNPRFLAVIFADAQSCPCKWFKVYAGFVDTCQAESLDLAIKVVLLKPDEGKVRELERLGVRRQHMVMDASGHQAEALGFEKTDLPFWLVLDTKGGLTTVMGGHVSPIYDEQSLAVQLLATLHSVPGGVKQ